MAVSAKLAPRYFTPPHNHTPLPTKNTPPTNLALLPIKEPSTLSLKTQLRFLNFPPKTPLNTAIDDHFCQNFHSLAVAFPALAFSNTLFFATNVELIVGQDEPEERLISRFRREVMKAGVIRECRRRRFFECSQEKRKRKSREAARRNRKRRPQHKVLKKDITESSKKKAQDSDEDNWEFVDVDIPYC